jgi:hypothetical protein
VSTSRHQASTRFWYASRRPSAWAWTSCPNRLSPAWVGSPPSTASSEGAACTQERAVHPDRRELDRELRDLRERSTLPNVTVRVLPFAVGLHRAHAGPFQILEFPDQVGADVVFIEGPAGDTYENQSDVDLYKDVLADVADRALDPESSREIVRRYELQHVPPGGRPR